uniref:Uncharacterized protein n=1 Tax=Rhizophora mucronata TaxID=61149 RepID=A0A2P2NPT4_RHIMU
MDSVYNFSNYMLIVAYGSIRAKSKFPASACEKSKHWGDETSQVPQIQENLSGKLMLECELQIIREFNKLIRETRGKRTRKQPHIPVAKPPRAGRRIHPQKLFPHTSSYICPSTGGCLNFIP